MARKTNVTINNRKYFRVTATVGRRPDGTSIRKQFYGKCKQEAIQKRDTYLYDLQQGYCADFEKRTLWEAFQEWFEHVHVPKLSLTSVRRYETCYRLYIQPSNIAAMKLAVVKALHIQMFYSFMLKGNISVNIVRSVHQLLSSFFSYCVKADIIVKNPLLAVEPPREKNARSCRPCLDKFDIVKIVDYVGKHIEDFIFAFAIFTGLRQGEILALTWGDVDIKGGFITVNKSVCYLTVNGRYQAVLSSTKTTNSIRQVPLLENIRPLLLMHMEAEKEKHIKKGIEVSDKSLLFSTNTCGYVDGRNLRKRLLRVYQKLDVKPTTFHGLRHTFCSILVENGVNPKTASELMGHSDTRTTLKIYTHVQDEEKKRGIATLANVFHGLEKPV